MVTLGAMGSIAGLLLRAARRSIVFWDRPPEAPMRAGPAA
jgi:hypothetical protein